VTYQMDGWQEPTLAENLARAGVSRRDFLKYCGALAAVFAAGTPVLGAASKAYAAAPGGALTADYIADTLGAITKPVVVWLQLQECTGCMESALRSGGTTIEELVLNLLSVDYNELVMAPSGEAAEKALHDANAGPHILVVNGSIPMGLGGAYCAIGGMSSEQILRDSAKNATAILAVGACAVWGSVQAAKPNPTGAVGVDAIIKDKPVINVAGCPPIGEVITATIAYILTHGDTPKTDAEGRPLFAYDQRIHDSCPRRPHFDAGEYVRTFDDTGARNGWCLYAVGCKGPSTFAPCPIIQWNMHTSWPIGAGHPCIGCTEKDFFDRFTPFYHVLPKVPGIGVETTAAKIGWGLTGAAVVGVGLHAGITAIRQHAGKKSEATHTLAAFGDPGSTAPPGSSDAAPPATEEPPAEAPEAPADETTGKAE